MMLEAPKLNGSGSTLSLNQLVLVLCGLRQVLVRSSSRTGVREARSPASPTSALTSRMLIVAPSGHDVWLTFWVEHVRSFAN